MSVIHSNCNSYDESFKRWLYIVIKSACSKPTIWIYFDVYML